MIASLSGAAEWTRRKRFLFGTPSNEGTSIASTAKQADIVLCMVTDDRASRAMWMGETGAPAGLKAGPVLLESSTLSIPWVKELASAAAAQNCHFLDAPVTESKAEVKAGKLLILAGGGGQA